MKIVVCQPGKAAYVKEIDGSLRSMQEVVGGYIETVGGLIDNAPVVLVCNEEGTLMVLPFCREFDIGEEKHAKFVGTLFFCMEDGDELVGIEDEAMQKMVLAFADNWFSDDPFGTKRAGDARRAKG